MGAAEGRQAGAMSFETMWRDLAPIGRAASSGGYFRQPFTTPERELRAWFEEQAVARGLELERDAFGNLFAWWRPAGPDNTGSTDNTLHRPAVLIGSHLDSVLDGGAFDGPLGVVSSFAAIDELRERGVTPPVPIAVGAFVEEEGSRFGLACLGSRLATGRTDWATARELRDRDGVYLADAMADAGLTGEPTGTAEERADAFRARFSCFVELHVEQGRGLIDLGAAVGVASKIWPHGRYRLEFTGEPNHAGTTLMEDRRDPMLTYAMTALAANKQARLAGARATFGRVEATPNSTNSVPSRVTAWLDARADTDEVLERMMAEVSRQAAERADRDGTRVELSVESASGAVHFDADLAGRLARGHEEGDWPILPTQAGHDAAMTALAGVPTAMLFVRNPTGVSHSPAEHADTADCLAGVHALADSLERVAV